MGFLYTENVCLTFVCLCLYREVLGDLGPVVLIERHAIGMLKRSFGLLTVVVRELGSGLRAWVVWMRPRVDEPDASHGLVGCRF